jgi:hypothetical protein
LKENLTLFSESCCIHFSNLQQMQYKFVVQFFHPAHSIKRQLFL